MYFSRWRCDGERDCADASDEKGCKVINQRNATVVCQKNQFLCFNGESCVNADWMCDGDADCTDHSDENTDQCQDFFAKHHIKDGVIETDKVERKMKLKVEADDKKCNEMDCNLIQEESVSEQHIENNCQDDEGCDTITNHCDVNKGGCDHICVIQDQNIKVCECYPGYELNGISSCKGSICNLLIISTPFIIDIDECESPTSCSQLCTNSAGSYSCSCVSGYTATNSSCLVTRGKVAIMMADQVDLILMDVVSGQTTPVVTSSYASAMVIVATSTQTVPLLPIFQDYHYLSGKWFWINSQTKRLMSYTVSTDDVTEIVDDMTGVVDIAVDWVHDNIYWTDSTRLTISATTIDGAAGVVDVVHQRLYNPQSIVVFPSKYFLFWTDLGDEPKIERSRLDGQERMTIVQEAIIWPTGISIDGVKERLYWLDVRSHSVTSSNLDGSRWSISSLKITLSHFFCRMKMLRRSDESLSYPWRLSVLEDYIYWSDWSESYSTIYRDNKMLPGYEEILDTVHMV